MLHMIRILCKPHIPLAESEGSKRAQKGPTACEVALAFVEKGQGLGALIEVN